MKNLETFLVAYKKNLKISKEKYPDEYFWGLDELDEVYGRMAQAIERGTYNKDSKSFKLTCKELGIKHTYTEINQFIKAEA